MSAFGEVEVGPQPDQARVGLGPGPRLGDEVGGAERITPPRTMPGKPADTRSAAARGPDQLRHRAAEAVGRRAGSAVGTRTRSATIAPDASSTEALSPVPPMSMARVSGLTRAWPGPTGREGAAPLPRRRVASSATRAD